MGWIKKGKWVYNGDNIVMRKHAGILKFKQDLLLTQNMKFSFTNLLFLF